MKMNKEKLEKEYQKNAEQLQKLRNRQKVLLNQKRVEERKEKPEHTGSSNTALCWRACFRKLKK